jgi:hypothetical protein
MTLQKLLLSPWVMPSISGALSICGLSLAVLAFWKSCASLIASIPEPQVNSAFSGFTVIRIAPCDEHRFAISVIKSRTEKFLVTADAKLRDIPDIIRGHTPSGRRIRSAEFAPPAISLIVSTKNNTSCTIRVLVVLASDHRIKKWVEIKLPAAP